MFFGIIGRLFYIMVTKSGVYKEDALKQQTDVIQIAAKRGDILDRNGNVLATSLDAYRVDADMTTLLQSIKGKMTSDELTQKIAAALNMPQDKVTKILFPNTQTPNNYPIIARQIDKTEADKIKALNILGLIVSPDTKRFYENGEFLSGVLGATDLDGNGVLGVELTYNKELSGIPGKMIYQKDVENNQLPYEDPQYIPPANGKNLYLTIDEKIQQFAEVAAQKALTENKAKSVTITVMNPNNGEVLAMVNKPDFNPNNPYGSGNLTTDQIVSSWKNTAVQNTFEPGSIFKVITAYAGLATNVVNDNTLFYDPGYIMVDGVRINCWDLSGHGTEHFVDIIKNSCNVGFVELGQKIGEANLYKIEKLFGFGEKTGIDLPGEAVGTVRPPDKTTNVDLANNSFGQGISLTAVEYMAAFNAVANGGTWIRPHVMEKITHKDASGNQVVDEQYSDYGKKQILDPAIASRLRQYLVHVVSDPTGVGYNANIPGYDIAGKTGTAQIMDPKTGAYSHSMYMASFAGMAPANNPRITLLVSVDQPDPSIQYYGSQVAAPVAKELFSEIFTYYKSEGIYDITSVAGK